MYFFTTSNWTTKPYLLYASLSIGQLRFILWFASTGPLFRCLQSSYHFIQLNLNSLLLPHSIRCFTCCCLQGFCVLVLRDPLGSRISQLATGESPPPFEFFVTFARGAVLLKEASVATRTRAYSLRVMSPSAAATSAAASESVSILLPFPPGLAGAAAAELPAAARG